MVYVGGPYRADVFFSYAHGGDTKLRKWSLRIPDELRREILISLSLPSGVENFQDPDLNRAGKFADELEANARGAAVLFVILSPYYIKSDWCAKERKWFIEALEEEGRDYDVIFVARALPTERDDLPPELRDRLGYPFHDETKAKSNRLVVRPFGWIKSTNDDLEAAILEVAGNIANRLQRIKKRNDAVQSAFAGFGIQNERAIYLHAVPEDKEAWCDAATVLNRRFAVVPGEARSTVLDAAVRERERQERTALCAECDALLLLRSRPGNWIEMEMLYGRRLSQSVHAFRQEMDPQRAAPIPWAVLDLVGDPLPLAERWRITRLQTTTASMAEDIAQWLQYVHGPQTLQAAVS